MRNFPFLRTQYDPHAHTTYTGDGCHPVVRIQNMLTNCTEDLRAGQQQVQ